MQQDVFTERFHRGVAPLRFLAQRHQADVVEITREPTGSLARGLAGGVAGTRGHRGKHIRFERGARNTRTVGWLATQQLVEDHSQGIDIGGRGDRFAPNLFRRCITRRHGPHTHFGQRGLVAGIFGDQLGYPEIEQLYRAIRCDQDIVRLEVAMHAQTLVSMVHGRAHIGKECEPLLQRQRVRFTMFGERLPLDVLHAEPGVALLRGSAIQQPRDIRMLEPRQDATFLLKSACELG